ncbi:MAG: hypothetical protein KGO50_00210 [Myxococcales bacterium]|nr:hypothetical protein [Myxococcales bacterium]
MFKQIPDDALTLADIPTPGTAWREQLEFCLSVDGYALFPTKRLAAFRAGKPPKKLTELRAALFYEQRRWRDGWNEPAGEDLEYIQGLVDAIRAHVALREALARIAALSEREAAKRANRVKDIGP